MAQARSFRVPITLVERVEAAEAQLRDAMMAGDVKALDDLLADGLVFINQIGQYLTKADDLAAHSSGRLRITQLDIFDQRVRAAETFAIETLVADVGGTFDGQRFSGLRAFGSALTGGGESQQRTARQGHHSSGYSTPAPWVRAMLCGTARPDNEGALKTVPETFG